MYDPTTAPDHEGIVVLGNTKVTFKDNTRAEKDGYEFLPTLLGYIASAGTDTGTTYMVMENLKSVLEPANPNQEIQAGKLVLINDENIVKIGLGVNSLTTFTDDKNADFSLIEVIETVDLIKNNTFKRKMFLGANIKILTSMTDLQLVITME